MGGWSVYLLVSDRTGSTYVGLTTDAERRLAQHNGERAGGAKSTRAGRPWRLARTWGPYETRSEASSREYRVKRRRGVERLEWIEPEAPPVKRR